MCDYFTSCVEDDPAHAAAEITKAVSFDCMGLGYEYYHEGPESSHPERSIYILLVDLSEHQSYAFGQEEAEELKTAWEDVLSDTVKKEILARIPRAGFPLAHIQKATEGTERRDLATVAGYMLANTKNVFMDSSYIDEEYPSYSDPWEPETVELLKASWKEAQKLWEKIHSEDAAAHAQPESYLKQVLDLLASCPPPAPTPEITED